MEPASSYLSRIVNPSDLKKFSDKELVAVAQEVRQAILDNVSKTGGHFSSNLGTVELTVALYAACEMPPDKVVWDTGHQAYPHKILTGRLPEFPTLRKYGGLSGFLKRSEHPLDSFGAGHAGTAISAAMGFAVARDAKGDNEKVIAITGDAAIASGMSWEALNHAGESGIDLTVVLNDNRMSIAPNVGALNNYLSRLRSRPYLQSLARKAKSTLEQFPTPIHKVAAGLRHGITHYMAPSETGTIFEEIGWEYIGPVDGHDVVTLLDIFRNIRELRFPVFVHAITVKGKGYDVAETDARKWHGVIPFDLESGTMAKAPGPITYTQAFGSAAVEAAEQDDQIIAITAAMPDGTGLTEFARKFPERYHDVGIAEPHAVTFAAGLAAGGMKPFCAIYSTFLQRAFDQILHDVCLQHLPVRFFLDRAGLVGDDGPTHHGSFDLSYLSLMPGLTILAPRDATELGEMVRWMKDFNQGPSVVRYPRGTSDDRLPEFRTPVQFGRAEVLTPNLARYDALLLSIGSTVSTAWQVFQDPRLKGSKLGVVNLRFAKPLDWECILDLSQRSRWVITIEENSPSGGIGQHIASKLAQIESFRGGVKCFSLPDEFVDHGNIDLLKRDIGLNADRITSEVESLIRA